MEELKKQIEEFTRERDWDQFHSPKNLAVGLSIEASELLENFLWVDDQDSYQLPEKKLDNLQDELGDVLIYLIGLADKFGLDPIACAKQKMVKNRQKYPVDLVRGSAKKYTEYSR